MSMNETPSGERLHIGLFGRRNAGKSSLMNALTGQATSVVSEVPGTTTDPVRKPMELLPIGPVVFIDTPGFDDEGGLGALRVERARRILEKVDMALLVVDATAGKSEADDALEALFVQREIPYLVVYTKIDRCPGFEAKEQLQVSSQTGWNIGELKAQIARVAAQRREPPHLVGDLVEPGNLVLLVTPIDDAAPKGRLILPQQQTIRDLLDRGAIAVVAKETEFAATLKALGCKPTLVITDSQVFERVAAETPSDIPLTSFSILMARRKGLLDAAVRGVAAIEQLRDGDMIWVCEGCTHHRQCGDIGSVKLPNWLTQYTGKKLNIQLYSGSDFPQDLSGCALVLHCGGCMLNERAMAHRVHTAREQNVPMTNYGIAIAYLKGILPRSLAIFPDLLKALTGNETIDSTLQK